MKWYTCWYVTKFHAVTENKGQGPRGAMQAVCGAWVYKIRPSFEDKEKIANGLPRCKHCERILEKHIA